MKLSSLPVVLVALISCAFPQNARNTQEVASVFADSQALYLNLHQTPELSSHEVQTAAKLASRLRALGYEVTEHIGGTGVVAVLKNGPGPAIMLRTELDALPVEEKTGLAYASKVHAKDDAGRDVSVMHACGHDLHMAALIGTAAIMAHDKQTWHGTLILIGQPAEETISGAKSMIADGLLTRFPRPDAAVALHVGNVLPAGQVGITSGYESSNADGLRVTIFGRGGHGAYPNTTVDPVVIAARTVLTLQTIASREIRPGEPVVVTVGYLQAGTKNNIIPDQAQLGMTVRTFSPEVRKRVLASVERIVKAEAEAGGAARSPEIERAESADAVYNSPALAARLKASLQSALGKDNVLDLGPTMTSEDFSYYVEQGVPGFYLALGGADPEKFSQSRTTGTSLPSNHSSLFAPDVEPALRTAITAEVAVLRDLLNGTAEALHKLTAGDSK